MKLARAILFVKDIDRMTAFYRDTLGLAELHREPGWVELDGLALHAIPAHIDVTVGPVREGTPIKLVFASDDAEAAGDRVDPEGNVFQIVVGSRA